PPAASASPSGRPPGRRGGDGNRASGEPRNAPLLPTRRPDARLRLRSRAAHFGVALHSKVKNALDAARLLVLGAQVLLGFQYRAFFERGYEKLGPAERGL